MLTNTTASTCSLTGYPALSLTNHGQPEPLAVQHQTPPGGYLYRYVPPDQVDIAPGHTASFGIEYLDRSQRQDDTVSISPQGTPRRTNSPSIPIKSPPTPP